MRKVPAIAAVLMTCLGGIALAQQGPSLMPPKSPPKIQGDATAPPAKPGEKVLTREDAETWLDGYMPYALQRGDVAGATVAIVKDGQILLQKGYGFSDVAKRKPVNPDTDLFRPGSVSKLFTWTAVMQQVEAGKLNLDADVNQYLDFKIPPYEGKPITLRNILTHTSGFEEKVRNLIEPDPATLPALGDYLKGWVPQRIFPPGKVPAYSNYATALAGYINSVTLVSPTKMSKSSAGEPRWPSMRPSIHFRSGSRSIPPTGANCRTSSRSRRETTKTR